MSRAEPMSVVNIISRCGREVLPYLDAVARLRIEVFRDFPYLYEGDLAYEKRYLQRYAECAESVFVLALDGEDVVGVSTGLPLAAAESAFQAPFQEVCLAVSSVFYLGESVLQASYRGQGIGHAFFDHREQQVRRSGCSTAAFCSVLRSSDHPLRPSDYRSNEVFWRKRGYEPSELYAALRWQQIDAAEEQENTLQFWLKQEA